MHGHQQCSVLARRRASGEAQGNPGPTRAGREGDRDGRTVAEFIVGVFECSWSCRVVSSVRGWEKSKRQRKRAASTTVTMTSGQQPAIEEWAAARVLRRAVSRRERAGSCYRGRLHYCSTAMHIPGVCMVLVENYSLIPPLTPIKQPTRCCPPSRPCMAAATSYSHRHILHTTPSYPIHPLH